MWALSALLKWMLAQWDRIVDLAVRVFLCALPGGKTEGWLCVGRCCGVVTLGRSLVRGEKVWSSSIKEQSVSSKRMGRGGGGLEAVYPAHGHALVFLK